MGAVCNMSIDPAIMVSYVCAWNIEWEYLVLGNQSTRDFQKFEDSEKKVGNLTLTTTAITFKHVFIKYFVNEQKKNDYCIHFDS